MLMAVGLPHSSRYVRFNNSRRRSCRNNRRDLCRSKEFKTILILETYGQTGRAGVLRIGPVPLRYGAGHLFKDHLRFEIEIKEGMRDRDNKE